MPSGAGSCPWPQAVPTARPVAHPAAHLHQVEIDKRSVWGVGVDINQILKPSFGQWD